MLGVKGPHFSEWCRSLCYLVRYLILVRSSLSLLSKSICNIDVIVLVISANFGLESLPTNFFGIPSAACNFPQTFSYTVRGLYIFYPVFEDHLCPYIWLKCRKDNIFARNENIGKICKRTITWTDFSSQEQFLIKSARMLASFKFYCSL